MGYKDNRKFGMKKHQKGRAFGPPKPPPVPERMFDRRLTLNFSRSCRFSFGSVELLLMTVTFVSNDDINVTSALSQNMGEATNNDFMPAFKLKNEKS